MYEVPQAERLHQEVFLYRLSQQVRAIPEVPGLRQQNEAQKALTVHPREFENKTNPGFQAGICFSSFLFSVGAAWVWVSGSALLAGFVLRRRRYHEAALTRLRPLHLPDGFQPERLCLFWAHTEGS
jgi:hypothetical protein